MIPHFDPLTGKLMLLPKPKASRRGGGGGGGVSRPPVTNVTSDPADVSNGYFIYNTSTNDLKLGVDGVWVTIGSSGSDLATFDFIDGGDFMFIDTSGFDFIG